MIGVVCVIAEDSKYSTCEIVRLRLELTHSPIQASHFYRNALVGAHF